MNKKWGQYSQNRGKNIHNFEKQKRKVIIVHHSLALHHDCVTVSMKSMNESAIPEIICKCIAKEKPKAARLWVFFFQHLFFFM